MFDRKSSYALNKIDPDAIVYTDADGHRIRLTHEDFDTEADFLKCKVWSDEDYHREEMGDHVEEKHKAPLDEKAGAADGPEVIIKRRIEKLAHDRYTAETVIRIKGQLTDKQFRRLCDYSGVWEPPILENGNPHSGVGKPLCGSTANARSASCHGRGTALT